MESQKTISAARNAEEWSEEADRFQDDPDMMAELAVLARAHGPAAEAIVRARTLYARALGMRSSFAGRTA